MADKENVSMRVTRSQARKAVGPVSTQPLLPAKRKRTALAEISNAPNQRIKLSPVASKGRNKKKTEERKEKGKEEETSFRDSDDPQLCAYYESDINGYLRSMEAEAKRRPKTDFIEKVQTDMTPHMRGILVDWLVEVAEEYKLLPDTLYLTTSYIDRYLSSNALNKQKLQLLGVSAMLIASKYEEITPPHVEDFCYITDNTYSKQEVVRMEADILKLLKFEMGNPTIKTFLRRYIKAGLNDEKISDLKMEFLANYLAELSLLDYGLIRFLPSAIAASAVFVARLTINPENHPWNATLEKQTGYKLSELKECIEVIHRLQLNKKSSLTAIREKYKQHKFKFVSSLVPPPEIQTSYFEGF